MKYSTHLPECGQCADGVMHTHDPRTLILIRGAPGSGKSSLARRLHWSRVEGAAHFEADMWFEQSGVYHFRPEQLTAAHRWCQDQTKQAMLRGSNTIIVSNCFIRRWELALYQVLARIHGYRVQEITLKANFGNIHGVPKEKVELMQSRFEE